MKFLFVVLSVWTAQAMAGKCASLYVYQPAKSCVVPEAGVIDESTAADLTAPTLAPTSPDQPGGTTPQSYCSAYVKQYDQNLEQYAVRGVLVEALPAGENKSTFGEATYNYACRYKQVAYQYVEKENVKCGLEDGYAIQYPDQPLDGLVGSAPVCLSCDDLPDDASQVQCLSSNMKNIISTGALHLSKRDAQNAADAILDRISILIENQSTFKTLNVDDASKLAKVNRKAQEIFQ